jgi:hypothetical protein
MLGPLRLLARAAARTLCTATPLLAFGACAPEGGRGEELAERAAVLSLAADVAVTVPTTAAAATEIRSGEHAVAFSLRGAHPVPWRVDEGGWLAARAAPGGGDVRLRRRSGGVEDWVTIPTADEAPDALRYDVDLRGADGLRAVGGVVEIVDAGGAPRLRIGPALVVDAEGATRAAALDVEGCAADRSAAPPWGRAVTAPGAARCTVVVRWDARGLRYPLAVDPPWTATSALAVLRPRHTTTRLESGRALVVGSAVSDVTELYDPATRTWAVSGTLTAVRRVHVAALLPDGRVLVAGGIVADAPSATAELYDPATGMFSATGALSTARHTAAAATLPDGRVLVTGGVGADELVSCEIYDPASETFGPTGSMALERSQHTATALADGRVLVLGAWGQGQPEIFAPATGTWAPSAPTFLGLQDHTATLLADGRVLVVGGRTGGGLSTTEAATLFDPVANTWAPAPDMPGPIARRRGHAAALLPDGRLAVVGGVCDDQCAPLVSFFQHHDGLFWTPGGATGTWAKTSGGTSAQRTDATATTLESGNVLVVSDDTSEELCLAEGCPCSAASECYSGNCVDGVCCDTGCTGTCTACSAALKKQGDDGACGPIGPGVDPQNECAATGAETCGLDGACDGAGACRFHVVGTVCAPSSCIDDASEIRADTCDGSGACVDNGDGPCGAGYLCDSGACAQSCVQAGQCATGYECIAGACAKRPNGAACDGVVQCTSGHCVDGVCCDGACQGQCEACAEPGALGACTPVGGEPRGERAACAPGEAPCQATCNGADPQACVLPGAEVSCGFGRVCDGGGACVQPDALCAPDRLSSIDSSGEPTSCAPYLCDPSTGACATSCTSASQCIDEAFCDDKRCQTSSGGTADDGGCSTAPGRGSGAGAALALAVALVAARRRRHRTLAAALVLLGMSGCSAGSEPGAEPVTGDDAAEAVTAAAPPEVLASPTALRIAAPERASGALRVADVASGVAVSVTLLGAAPVEAEPAAGGVRYREAGPGGGDVRLLLDATGVEDFVTVAHPSLATELRYRFETQGAAGLRRVGGSLELLDAAGVPRLRVPRPYVLDARGVRVAAELEVEGCAVDRDPRPSFDRPLTPPGAGACTLAVRWPGGLAHPIEVDPAWTTTAGPGDLDGHATALLADGSLLVVGGSGVETLRYAAGAFSAAADMAVVRTDPTATRLDDGRVLVAGGGTATAELYDPTSGTWSAASPMGSARQGHTALRLDDGSVLVTGGDSAGSSERYLAATDQWVAAGLVGGSRPGHTTTLLADGRVLLVGGSSDLTTATSTRIFSIANGWANGPTLQEPRSLHVAARLPSGEVLIAGGDDIVNGPGALATVERFDPAGETLTPGAAMLQPTRNAAWLTFASGAKVYVVGGRHGGATSDTTIYDAPTGTWSAGESMNRARNGHTADLLPTGHALVIGGSMGSETFPPCELECIDLGCPCTASACLVGSCVDGVCCDSACAGACQACSAAKKGGGSDGQCGPVADGADPDDDCALTTVETCGTLGFCDGMGACRVYAAGTECAAASCLSEALLSPASTCDGVGACVTPAPVACQSGAACGEGACSSTCRGDEDCATGFVCSEGLCVQKAPGDACSVGSECATGVCADGVCCDQPCTGQCESCASPGTLGLCVQVKGAPVSKEPCAGEGTCQGVCDQDRAACTFPSGSCGPASTCSNGVCVQTVPVCSPDGEDSVSPAGETTPCTPYRCDPVSGVCLDACTVAAQCGDAFACVDGQCIDAGGSAAGPEATADDGCACRAAPRPSPSGAASALLLAVVVLLSVRGRKRLQPRA